MTSIAWYETAPLSESSHQILMPHSSLQVSEFLILGSDDALLIDAGIGVGDLAGFLAEITETEPLLGLTHSHWDHIGNAHQFDRVVVHPAERPADGRITTDSLSDIFARRPQQFVADQRTEGLPFPEGFDPDGFDIPPADGVGTIEPGDSIDLGDRTVEVIALPGHSPGHVGFLDRTDGILYAGDAIRGDGVVLAYFDHSDVEAYRETIDRVRDLRDSGAFSLLASAHGGHVEGEELAILDELSELLGRILDDDLGYDVVETDRDGTKIRQYDTGFFEIKTPLNL